MRRFALAIATLALSLAPANAGLVIFTGELTTSDPTFNRPSSLTTLSGVGTNVFYDAIDFTVTQSGLYDIDVFSFPGDSYFAAYFSPFNPASPLTNLGAVDDDSSFYGNGLQAGFTLNLVAGTEYTLVMTTFANGDTGAYTIFFDGPGDAVFPGAPEPPPAAVVPVPATALVAALGMAGLGWVRRRRVA